MTNDNSNGFSNPTLTAKTPASYPIQLHIEYPDRKLNRWSCFFRLILVIPVVLLAVALVGHFYLGNHDKADFDVTGILFIAPLIMILFFKKYPKWWFDWNLELYRFLIRISAYASMLTHEYPSTDLPQLVKLDIVYPEEGRLNRFLPLVKWLLAIPHYIILIFLSIGAVFAVIFAWFAILFTGRFPQGLFNFIVGVKRWAIRVTGYAFLLMTDQYPPFSLN